MRTLFITVIFIGMMGTAQAKNFFPVSHETGYYETDSLFFEVFQGTWDPDLYELQWSVNRFTEQSFVPYTGGIWLKDRSYTPNTWEDVHIPRVNGDVTISFYGNGFNDISVSGSNSFESETIIRLVAISTNSFNVYLVESDSLVLVQENLQPTSLANIAPYTITTEGGWSVHFEKGFGYTIGDQWEIIANSSFYLPKYCTSYSDFKKPRGILRKVNTVRIRLVEKTTRKVVQQEVKIIGFGQQPHNHHLLFATADSSDIVDMFTVDYYKADIKRPVYLHILNPNGVVEFEGVVEWDNAAGSSYCRPNHGVAFKARGELGTKNMTTSIYGTLGEKVDKIKMRVGGNGAYDMFSVNEIFEKIITYQNIFIGGVQTSIATWYLNGSYWSLGFPQEQPRKRYVERVLGVDKDDVDVIMPIPILTFDTIYSFFAGETKMFTMVLDPETAQLMGLENTNKLTVSEKEFFIDPVIMNHPISDKKLLVGDLKDGNTIRYIKIATDLMNLLDHNQKNTDSILIQLLDIDQWVRSISFAHFHNLKDYIENNTSHALTSKTRMIPLLTDFDVLKYNENHSYNHFEYIFQNLTGLYSLNNIIFDIIRSSPSAMSRLALVYQDLLNTSLRPERTVKIVENMRDVVMPHYEEYHLSWGGSPNGGLPAEYQNMLYDNLAQFYTERPENAFQLMADYVLRDHGFVNDDRNVVNIVFDSIPEGIVEVKFNSLTLYENFSGLYFPKPHVEISYVVKEGYSVYIKEYPMFSDSFTLGADSTLNITFIMRKDSVVNSLEEGWNPEMEIYPNPVRSELFFNGLYEDNLSYSIVSALGSVVVDQLPLRYPSIPVDFLPVGSYFLRVDNGKDFIVKKFIKV